MNFSFLRVLALLGALSTSFGASITLFDELNAPTAGNDAIARFGPLAASFSTSASPSSLTDVMAKLTVAHATNKTSPGSDSFPAAASYGAAITVALYSDAGTRPGSLLATIGSLPDTSLPGGLMYQNFDFPVNPPVLLNSNTRYWIVFS